MTENGTMRCAEKNIRVPTERGCLLDGVLFHVEGADTAVIIIGELDRFAEGDPHAFLERLSSHMRSHEANRSIRLEIWG